MPITSRWTTPTPEVSLQKWVFGSSSEPLPDRKIFYDAESPDTNFLTLSDFRLLSKRIALGLQRAGLRHGERVLLCSGNSIKFPPIFMGVLMAGGIFTGASPALKPQELAHQIRDSGASFIIVAGIAQPTAVDACGKLNFPMDRLYCLDSTSDASQNGTTSLRSWTDLLASAAEAERFDWLWQKTGPPKGVEITHFSYVANGETTVFLRSQAPPDDKGKTDASICFMPLYHAAGQTTFIVNNPRMGVPTYIMPSYNFERLLQHIEAFQITTVMTAPPILLSLAKSPLSSKYDLSSLTNVVCGTAALAPEIADEVESKLWPQGESFVSQGWGMTEITCTGTLWSPDDRQKTSSIGEIVPNASFKIMDNGTEVTEPQKTGELWFSGPTLMKGYWRNPRATEEAVSVDVHGTRWLKTGDVVYVDKYETGAKLFLVDRIKDLIKARGFQVSPVELEALLIERKDVLDAAVVGVMIQGEETPRAYVVKNSDATEEEVAGWLNDRVPKYKQLRGGVVFVDSIPRLQSGKILRRELRQRAQMEVGTGAVKAKLS